MGRLPGSLNKKEKIIAKYEFRLMLPNGEIAWSQKYSTIKQMAGDLSDYFASENVLQKMVCGIKKVPPFIEIHRIQDV